MKTHAILLLISIAFFAGCHPQNSKADPPAFTVEKGKLDQSLIAIAVPAKWNGDVLIFAHGLRKPDSPLVADFSTSDALFKGLIADGWMIASTSFRRNNFS